VGDAQQLQGPEHHVGVGVGVGDHDLWDGPAVQDMTSRSTSGRSTRGSIAVVRARRSASDASCDADRAHDHRARLRMPASA
jgi:hypothetical protein